MIVFGYSHLGRYGAEKLEDLGFDYVILTRDHNLYHELVKKQIFAELEYETQPMVALKAAGIEKAPTVVIAHSEDSVSCS